MFEDNQASERVGHVSCSWIYTLIKSGMIHTIPIQTCCSQRKRVYIHVYSHSVAIFCSSLKAIFQTPPLLSIVPRYCFRVGMSIVPFFLLMAFLATWCVMAFMYFWIRNIQKKLDVLLTYEAYFAELWNSRFHIRPYLHPNTHEIPRAQSGWRGHSNW